MRVIGFAGWSGSGKTTLLTRVLPLLRARGLRCSTLKRAHHRADVDTPGKDTHRHRTAGAGEVMLVTPGRWALMHEGPPPVDAAGEPDLAALFGHFSDTDLVLVEGFKSMPLPKIEVYRPALGKPPLFTSDPWVRAVASDAALPTARIPVLDLNDPAAVADFVVQAAVRAPVPGLPLAAE